MPLKSGAVLSWVSGRKTATEIAGGFVWHISLVAGEAAQPLQRSSRETGAPSQETMHSSIVADIHPLADKLRARSLALIREKGHHGRNSFRPCGFRRVGPTIGTAIVDISTCCHGGWACRLDNRYNRKKRRFS